MSGVNPLAALGSAFQGFAQGRQYYDEQQKQKAELERQARIDKANAFAGAAELAKTNPALAKLFWQTNGYDPLTTTQTKQVPMYGPTPSGAPLAPKTISTTANVFDLITPERKMQQFGNDVGYFDGNKFVPVHTVVEQLTPYQKEALRLQAQNQQLNHQESMATLAETQRAHDQENQRGLKALEVRSATSKLIKVQVNGKTYWANRDASGSIVPTEFEAPSGGPMLKPSYGPDGTITWVNVTDGATTSAKPETPKALRPDQLEAAIMKRYPLSDREKRTGQRDAALEAIRTDYRQRIGGGNGSSLTPTQQAILEALKGK